MPRGGGGCLRGYKPGGVYLQKDSRPARALEILRHESVRVGHALTLPEWRAAYRTATGDPRPLNMAIDSLRRRKLVVPVASRGRNVQYRAADTEVQAHTDVDLHAMIIEIVTTECDASGHAVALHTVVTRLAAAGVVRGSDDVGGLLAGLTVRPKEGAKSQRNPDLDCIRIDNPAMGRRRRYWRPFGSAYMPADDMYPSLAAAMRVVVRLTADTIGWAPSPREIYTWLGANHQHPAAVVLREARVPRVLHAILKRAPTTDADLVDVTCEWSSDGGAPHRTHYRGGQSGAVATARFIDACYLLRPVEELASAARLTTEAKTLGLPQLAALAAVRAGALAAAMRLRLPHLADADSSSWSDIAQRLERGVAFGRAEHAARIGSTRRKLPAWLIRAESALDAVPVVEELLRAEIVSDRLGMVGSVGMRPAAMATDWLREIARPEGREIASPQAMLARARRVPNPLCDRGKLYDAEPQPFSQVDVGDILGSLVGITSNARILVLLQCAIDILGYSMRDAGPVRWLLRELPPYERLYRHAAVVALAALGSYVRPQDVIQDRTDEDGLTAFVLAVGISTMGLADRKARMELLRDLFEASLQDRVREMSARIAAGDTTTAAM